MLFLGGGVESKFLYYHGKTVKIKFLYVCAYVVLQTVQFIIATDIQLLRATRQSLLGRTPFLRLQKSLLSCPASSVQRGRKQHAVGMALSCIILVCKDYCFSMETYWIAI